MNIKEAKEQIANAVKAYLTKNEFGEYIIPIERQRPVFMIGAPGIGKTAIMEQIAQELNVGLVSYSMTPGKAPWGCLLLRRRNTATVSLRCRNIR